MSMSRRSVESQRERDPYTARFANVKFIQGDCLKPETLPESDELGQYEAVIHTVGSLLEGSEYKNLLNGNIIDKIKNP
jgi:hypothetical protein